MDVRKTDGTREEFNREKLSRIIKKAYRSAKVPVTKAEVEEIIDSLYVYEGILCSSIRQQLEHRLKERNEDVYKAYVYAKRDKDSTSDMVRRKKEFIGNYKKSKNNADATIDDNSNVGNKNIGVLNAEIHKQDNIETSREMIMDKLAELYPNFNKRNYKRDLESHIIYKHDESSFCGPTAPYCVSITMYPFLTNGIRGLGGLSAAPKNIDSFCGMYTNLIFSISAMYAGAVATSEFLLYFTYFAKKEYGEDFWKHPDRVVTVGTSRNQTIMDQLHQYWQHVVYTINQPMGARGLQSAFTNFSYFDKPFFEGMFGDFYFPDGSKPDWESLSWIQKEFMKWFNEERTKTMLTFPVESFTLLYKDGEFQDKDSFEFVCDEYARGHSFFTYISDTVDSLSSCCFRGNTEVEWFEMEDPEVSRKGCIQDAYDECAKKLIDGKGVYNILVKGRDGRKVPARAIMLPHKDFVRVTMTNGEVYEMTENHINLYARDGIMNEAIDLFPGDELLSADSEKKFIVESVERVDYPENCFCFEMENEEEPYFTLPSGLITHNCRLKNKIQTKEFNFTNGNIGIQTGSKSVITLNLSRITQDWFRSEQKKNGDYKFSAESYPSLKKHIGKILERVYKYHTAYNEWLWDMYDAKLLPAYLAGFIDLNKQYMTIGLNGLNQAAEFLGMECSDNDRYAEFCQNIFGYIKEQNELHKVREGHKLTFNTEMVPAESLAIKNYNWDKEDGYWVPDDTNLYASYIYKPNDKKRSVIEKIKMHGSRYIGDYLDGGSAAHINLDTHLSAAQYRHLLRIAAKEGCSYITWNIPNSVCEDCGYISKVPLKKCPRCGSTRISLYDRIIGYLTKILNWSAGRQIEQKTRVYSHCDCEGDEE